MSGLTWCGPHADEAARVAETPTTVSLISRGSVVVESEIGFAGCPLHAHRIAAQRLPLIALAQLRALRFVVPVQLQQQAKGFRNRKLF